MAGLASQRRLDQRSATAVRLHRRSVERDRHRVHPRRRGRDGRPRDIIPFDFDSLRKRFVGAYIANNGYDLDLATARLAEGKADLFAFGRPFIANPDLVERLKTGAPLA
ncbi:hypothetical protein ACRAWD_26710 [Caulobacter segnis]